MLCYIIALIIKFIKIFLNFFRINSESSSEAVMWFPRSHPIKHNVENDYSLSLIKGSAVCLPPLFPSSTIPMSASLTGHRAGDSRAAVLADQLQAPHQLAANGGSQFRLHQQQLLFNDPTAHFVRAFYGALLAKRASSIRAAPNPMPIAGNELNLLNTIQFRNSVSNNNAGNRSGVDSGRNMLPMILKDAAFEAENISFGLKMQSTSAIQPQTSPLILPQSASSSFSPKGPNILASSASSSASSCKDVCEIKGPEISEGDCQNKSQLFLVEQLLSTLNNNNGGGKTPSFVSASSSSTPPSKASSISPAFVPVAKHLPSLQNILQLNQPPSVQLVSPTNSLEYVNGGYGLKNPLLQGVTPPDVDPTPAPTSNPGAFVCRICRKVDIFPDS